MIGRLISSLSLILLVLSSACGRSTPAADLPTKAPEPTTLAAITSTPTPPAAYPPPEPTGFDGQLAYPGLDQTQTAEVQTLTAVPTRTPTPLPPTATITPTRVHLSDPLPAPVYMLISTTGPDEPSEQIYRLERDGYTLLQITDEEKGVEYPFDVAADGRLAYVSNNRLVVTDSLGKNRKVLVAGIPDTPREKQDAWYFDKEEIYSPAWSPDGRKIAYWKAGVNLLNLSIGKTIQIAAGQKWTTNIDGKLVPEDERAPHYLPIDWTPDGSRIVLQVWGYETMKTAFIDPTPGAKLVFIEIPGEGCCDYSFTRDGQMLFSSGDHAAIGLWLVDPKTGKGKRLTVEKTASGDDGPLVSSPIQALDGRLFFLTTKSPEGWTFPAFVGGSKIPFRVPEDVTYILKNPAWEGALWQPDASRVLAREWNSHQLAIIETKSGKVIPLELQGYGLHWGVR